MTTMFARIALVIALLFPFAVLAQPLDAGQTSGDLTLGSAHPDAGSASAPLDFKTGGATEILRVPAPTPADKLHDPASSPSAAWDDLRAAKKDGWAIAAFAALVMLCKLIGRFGKKPWLAFLGKGKVAVVVGAIGALGTACFNAAAEGGAWSAILMAGAAAVFAYLDLGEKAKA